ncbi:unnamed protein product, partial [Polarella glacialis]
MQSLSPAFLQGFQALQEVWQPICEGGAEGVGGPIEPPPPATQMAKQLAKTEFCKHHIRGFCRYKAKCAYAHSMEELQSRPNLTRTKLCISFMSGNFDNTNCSYASRTNAAATERAAFCPIDDGWISESVQNQFPPRGFQ